MARYAVILKETGEVIDIKLMEGAAPEINADTAHLYDVLEAPAGVMIGMVKGGPQLAADGWGYPKGMDASNRNTALPKPPLYTEKDGPPSSHEKVRSDAPKASAAQPAPKAATPAVPPKAKADAATGYQR